MRPKLEDQVALVTGASSGIGKAIALRLVEAGSKVVGVARSADRLAEIEEEVRSAGGSFLALPADLTHDAEADRTVLTVLERLGRVAVLVNAAGFATARTPIAKANIADWDRTMATCLRAPMNLVRLVLPDMIAHRQGAIVNIVSIAARQGRAGEAAYAAAKAGLLAFTQSLRAEVREHGIKVTAICPGYVDTDFIPENKNADRAKFLQPNDIAEIVHDALRSPIRMCPAEIYVEPQFDAFGK